MTEAEISEVVADATKPQPTLPIPYVLQDDEKLVQTVKNLAEETASIMRILEGRKVHVNFSLGVDENKKLQLAAFSAVKEIPVA